MCQKISDNVIKDKVLGAYLEPCQTSQMSSIRHKRHRCHSIFHKLIFINHHYLSAFALFKYDDAISFWVNEKLLSDIGMAPYYSKVFRNCHMA